LWTGATQALQVARVTGRLSTVVARDLARRALCVPDDLPLAEAVRRAQEAQATSILTTTSDGRPVGVVDEEAVRAMPESRRPWVAVSTVARALDNGLALPIGISGPQLLDALRRRPASEYVLVAEDGSVYGVLATADVLKAIQKSG
ncbi:MAG TPA: CBS domain-containing protein, partial [Acidimicrobiales bacterium]